MVSGLAPILALRTDGPRAARLPRFVPLSNSRRQRPFLTMFDNVQAPPKAA